jgi:hypothetical protein
MTARPELEIGSLNFRIAVTVNVLCLATDSAIKASMHRWMGHEMRTRSMPPMMEVIIPRSLPS